jgi:hypothetical protein
LYTTNFLPDPCGNVRNSFLVCHSLRSQSFSIFLSQINPATYVSENYYEVDGVLTTKLEQVSVSTQDKKLPRCSDDTAVVGKGGVHYLKHGAFCLETQKFPDAVHHVMRSQKLLFPRTQPLNLSLSSGKLPVDHSQPRPGLSAPRRLQVRHRIDVNATEIEIKKKKFFLSSHMTMEFPFRARQLTYHGKTFSSPFAPSATLLRRSNDFHACLFSGLQKIEWVEIFL